MSPLTLTVAGAGLVAMTAEQYHADPCERPSLSSSIAKELCNGTPAHARLKHPRLNPDFRREDKTAFDIGTVAHQLILEGDANVEIIDGQDWRTKAAQEARDAARDAGKTPLLAKEWEQVEALVNAARRQLEMFDCDPAPFTDGKPEQALIWDDDGVTCRALFDWPHNDHTAIDDLKTTGTSADPNTWARKTLYTIGADIQAAFYLRGYKKAFGLEPTWRFIVVETTPPYALSIVTPSPDVLTLAGRKVEHAIATWRKCLAENHWPAYTRQVSVAELPSWVETDWTNRGLS